MAGKVSINGKEYDMDDLSETARQQVMNLRVAEMRIAQLEQDLAMMKTARLAYARALDAQLPKE